MECSTHGFTLHHVPRNSDRTGAIESMEMIITIVSISIRLVVIYRMPPSKKNKLRRGTFVTEFSDYIRVSTTH